MRGESQKSWSAENRSDPDFPYLGPDERIAFPDPEGIDGSLIAVGGTCLRVY